MTNYRMFLCIKCGHEVHAKEIPQPIHWTDGHVCEFEEATEEDLNSDTCLLYNEIKTRKEVMPK